MSEKYWSLPYNFQKARLLILLSASFLLTLFSLTLTTTNSHIAWIWLPAALMTAVVFRSPPRHIFPNLLFCFAGILLADHQVYGISPRSVHFALIDVVQAGVAGMTLRALLDNKAPFNTLQDLRQFTMSAGLLFPLAGGLVAWETVRFSGQIIPNFFLIWVVSKINAILTLGPILLLLPLPKQGMRIPVELLIKISSILIITLLLSYFLMPFLPWPYTLLTIILMWSAVKLPLLQALVLFFAHNTLTGILLLTHRVIHPVADSLDSQLYHWLPLTLVLLSSQILAIVMEAFRREKDRIYESEARFRHALDHMTIGVALKLPGIDGPWSMINHAFCALLGYKREEIYQLGFEQLTHPDDRARDLEQADGIINGEAISYTCEKRYLHKEGHNVWVRRTLSMISDANQRPLYFLLQVADLSEIKKSEQSRRGLQTQISLANEAGNISVWEWNLTTGERKWDKATYERYNLPPGTVVTNELWMKHIHPDDQPKVKATIQQAIEKEENAFVFEFRILRPYGTQYMRTFANRMINPEGQVLLIGISKDITHERILNDALHQEKERMSVTLSSIGEAVISTDEAMNITYMNPAAERFSGWTQSEAAGKAVCGILHITHGFGGASLAQDNFRQLPEKKIAAHVEQELVLHNRNGDAFDIHYSITPLKTLEGERIGSVIIINDVSESRSLLKALNYNASHDRLTGLPNRACFEKKLRQMLSDLRETERLHVLAFIDLDKFKNVNDSAGHAAGDALLCGLAKLMTNSMRKNDFLARLGGDEFGLIMADTHIDQAKAVIQQLVEAVNAYPFEWDHEIYYVGASAGITQIDSSNYQYEDVLSQADIACYKAKNQGRGQYVMF